MSSPRRNVELKATDPDPERSLAVCRELGAEDRGILVQRDTYFRVARRPPEAARGDARRRRADPVPPLRPARGAREPLPDRPVEDGAALREALDAALGTLVVVDKERRLLLWEGVRIHLDTVEGLGSFLELEGVAPEDSDLSAERDRVAQLSEALGLDETRILADSYSDRVLAQAGGEELIAAARGAMERAYAPYSQLPRRRRAARAGRLGPRRRQRRERRLPARQLRRGVGDRRADRGGPHARSPRRP